MKIALIDQIAKVNYKYTFPLVNGLMNEGVEVDLIIDQKKEEENCKCKKYRLFNTDEKNISKIKKIMNYICSYRKIIKIIKEEKYDVLHTEWYILSPIDYYYIKKIKKRNDIKYVATVHDILPFNQKIYDMYFHKKLYHMADTIILQAPENMKRFASIFPEEQEKTVMIPHGHMLDYVEYASKKESRIKLGISNEKKVFLFFGQIKKVKGVDILLRAMAEIKDKYSDLCLVIAGSVWKADFDECLRIIDEKKLEPYVLLDIRYIPDEEVKYYYSAADICVLPYTDVYQSGVIQLAYGYKKTVVSSDLPAFTQFVKEGETGFLSKVGDTEDLSKALERALKHWDKLEILGQNGYNLVKNDLDWNLLAKDICNLYIK